MVYWHFVRLNELLLFCSVSGLLLFSSVKWSTAVLSGQLVYCCSVLSDDLGSSGVVYIGFQMSSGVVYTGCHVFCEVVFGCFQVSCGVVYGGFRVFCGAVYIGFHVSSRVIYSGFQVSSGMVWQMSCGVVYSGLHVKQVGILDCPLEMFRRTANVLYSPRLGDSFLREGRGCVNLMIFI